MNRDLFSVVGALIACFYPVVFNIRNANAMQHETVSGGEGEMSAI